MGADGLKSRSVTHYDGLPVWTLLLSLMAHHHAMKGICHEHNTDDSL